MIGPFDRLVSAWQFVLRRGLAQWRLLSSVVLGVVLASAIMAGTVIYFDALRELALKHTLGRFTSTQLDLISQTQKGPATALEHDRISATIEEEIDRRIAWMLKDRIHAGKSPTFFLAQPGRESRAGNDNARAYFAFLPRMEEHITIAPGGRMPSDRGIGSPLEPPELEAIIPTEAAKLFDVNVGDRLAAVAPWDDRFTHATVHITGIFRRENPDHEIWFLEQKVLQSATGEAFRTVPFHVDEGAFFGVLGQSMPKMDGIYAWLLDVDTGRLNARNAKKALDDLDTLNRDLTFMLPSYSQVSSLNPALEEYDRRLFFSKLPMFVVLVLIAVVILYYVATLSSLVVEDRRAEVALLRSRGATSSQVLMVFILEGSAIAILAVVFGPILAAASISVMGYTPAFSDLSGGGSLSVYLSAGAYQMSALGGVLSFVALVFPAVQASRIGVTRHRQQVARPASQPAFQRYYIDVLLLLVSIYLFRQLTEQGSVLATSLFGEVAVNQILLALPGLVLVASALVLLRLFPLVMSLASQLLSRWLPVGLVMGVWQMARNPTHYARLSLLLILTAGLGIFASSFGATLELSFTQRVLYSTGSDLRISEIRPATRRGQSDLVETYEEVEGVVRASPVLRRTGHDLSEAFGQSYLMLAMDGESFHQVGWFRNDFSKTPIDELLRALKQPDPPQGITLPSGSQTLGVTLKADRRHPSIALTARVQEGAARYVTYRLGALRSSEWSDEFETALPPSEEPRTLVSLRIHESRGARRLQAGSILIDNIWVGSEGGNVRSVIEDFDHARDWSVLRVASESPSDVLRATELSSDGGDGSLLFSWSDGSPLTARGIFHGGEPKALPVLASRSFVQSTGHQVGDTFDVSAAGLRIPIRLTDTITLFPTVTSPTERFLIADLTSLTRYANLGAIDRVVRPNELWLSSDTTGAKRRELVKDLEAVKAFSSNAIHDRSIRLEKSKVDPLVEAGWRSLLFIAFSAVLILSGVGFLVHAYVSFRNRQVQFALLRTVGFSMRQLITMVWLEHVLVIGAGLGLGTWMGGRLGATIMPFLGHDDWGDQVVPPFAMQINWGALIITYALIAVVFAIISLGLIWLIHKISLQRILRLGEM